MLGLLSLLYLGKHPNNFHGCFFLLRFKILLHNSILSPLGALIEIGKSQSLLACTVSGASSTCACRSDRGEEIVDCTGLGLDVVPGQISSRTTKL
jgi:hypothetical protein